MNVLIIKAHPASYGFTHTIADVYKETAQKADKQVEIIDLYDEQYAQPFLRFEDIKKDTLPTQVTLKIQEKITWADELVFVTPVWQMGVPAIVKNFFDINLSAGFAFNFTKDGVVKLLTGKRARFFLTADGPPFLYRIYGPILKHLTLGGFLTTFGGATIKSITIFTLMRKKKNDRDREKMLNKVRMFAWKK